MSWDTLDTGTDGGLFFKLESEKNYTIAFLGEPKVVSKDWGDGPKPRVHSNIVETSSPDKVLIFDMPLTVARQVKDIFGLSETTEILIKLRKTGSGLQTKYTVVAGPAIKPETLAKLAKLELHELGTPGDSAASPATDEDVPF